jgi:hypothetical protein
MHVPAELVLFSTLLSIESVMAPFVNQRTTAMRGGQVLEKKVATFYI